MDVLNSLHHIIEESGSGVVDVLALPKRKGVDEEVLDAAQDERVSRAVGVLVPAVGGADGDLGEHLLHLPDHLEQLSGLEIATVEGLGADGDGGDDIFVSGDGLFEGGLVCIEGLGDVGPGIVRTVQSITSILHSPNAKDNLEVLRLGGWDDGLCVLAVAGRVGSHDRRMGLEHVKVLLKVLLGLAGAVGVLDAQGESEGAGGRDGEGGGRESSGEDGGKTHGSAKYSSAGCSECGLSSGDEEETKERLYRRAKSERATATGKGFKERVFPGEQEVMGSTDVGSRRGRQA